MRKSDGRESTEHTEITERLQVTGYRLQKKRRPGFIPATYHLSPVTCRRVFRTLSLLSREGYCQRKIFRAIRKLTTPQADRIATPTRFAPMEAPSFITARKVSLSAVNGSALMIG